MNLLNVLLKVLLSKSTLTALMKKTGLSPAKLKKLIPLALPLLLKYMTGNASNQAGALSLLGALGQHTSNKSVPAQIAEADEVDGGKILGHILGSDSDAAIRDLSRKSGMSSPEVSKALSSLAPALLCSLSAAKESAKGKVDLSDGLDLSDLTALLGGGQVASNPFGLLGGLFGGTGRKAAKDDALNGNELISSLMSFMG